MSKNKNILITGGTGFIGTTLCKRLDDHGYTIFILSRTAKQRDNSGAINYISELNELDGTNIDSVINLAGEPLAAKRWNSDRKAEFVNSRVETTRQLFEYFQQQNHHPESVISGSAIGYYGACDDQHLVEQSSAGSGFAANLCQQWEDQAANFETLGVRLCIVRIGVVLGPNGGAFDEMRRSFDLKVASRLGHGEQWMSWIHLDDMVSSLLFLLQNTAAKGVFNCTAPEPVTNSSFTDAMKRATGALLNVPMPAFALRAIVGEMADEVLLVGQRVIPKHLLETGFEFKYTQIDSAVKDILKNG